jgi:hypothetical protein
MPKTIEMKIEGLSEAVETLKTLGQRGQEAVGQLLKNFADTLIVAPAKEKYVPVATGNLRSTIRSVGPVIDGPKVTMLVVAGGPAAPYALKVHENPRAGKTGGVSPQGKKYPRTKGGKPTWATRGQWKYLETPAIEAANDRGWLRKEGH